MAPPGSVLIADATNNRVRVVIAGTIETFAGTGAPGAQGAWGNGGPATSAQLSNPQGVCAAPDGTVYIADTFHYRIRAVAPTTNVITTLAGSNVAGYADDVAATATALWDPSGCVVDPTGTHSAWTRRAARL